MKVKSSIPDQLKDKIPPHLTALHGYWCFFALFGLGLAVFGLAYGAMPERNGFRYLLVPLICPWISVTYFFLFPQNPYRGTTLIYPNNLNGLDQADADAKRLVDIYRSVAARRFLTLCALITCGILFAVMIVVAIIQWNTLNWEFSFNAPGVGEALFGCTMGSFIFSGMQYLEWGFRKWLKSYHES